MTRLDRRSSGHAIWAILIGSLLTSCASAAEVVYSPIWFDGFDVSANSSDINFEAEVGLRQGGFTVEYVTNTADSTNDYHHQVFGPGGAPLQLAGDGNPPQSTLVSPNFSFIGPSGSGIAGKQISIAMDAFTNAGGSPQEFAWSAITIGSSAPLQAQGAAVDGLSVVFVEDTFAGNGNFIQIFEGSTLVDNLLPNPADAGWGTVQFFVDDPIDGDPWDGLGTTEIAVSVNGTDLGSVGGMGTYVFGGGGLTSNFITLEGSLQTNIANPSVLATHVFDNVTVFEGTAIPEPGSLALLAMGGLGMVVTRRRRR